MAAKMAQEGRSVEEINAYLEESIARRRIYFGIYNLKYAGKSGRIPSAAAFIGDKIGIKPIMKIWDHEITTAGKCRGERKMILRFAIWQLQIWSQVPSIRLNMVMMRR